MRAFDARLPTRAGLVRMLVAPARWCAALTLAGSPSRLGLAGAGGNSLTARKIIAHTDDAHTLIFAERKQTMISRDNRLAVPGECALHAAELLQLALNASSA